MCLLQFVLLHLEPVLVLYTKVDVLSILGEIIFCRQEESRVLLLPPELSRFVVVTPLSFPIA